MLLGLLCCLSLLSGQVELVIGQVSFITRPTNVSANELETVTLTCTINYTSIYYRYHWSKDGVEISAEAKIYTNTLSELGIDTNRYSILTWYRVDNGQVKYDNNLRIVNVKHNYSAPDSGVYAVYVNDITNGEPGIEILRSDDVYLVVRKDPPITDPECTDVPTTVREGEGVSLECTSERGNPEVTLKWSVTGDTENVLNTMLSSTVSMLTLSYVWSPHYTEQGVIFTCTSRRSSPYEFDRSCEVGPFDIQYKPKVILQQVDTGQGSESELRSFTCSWLANPNASDILWYFDNIVIDGSQGRYVIDIWNDYSTLVVQNISHVDHNMPVECEVNNLIGMTKASSFLVVATETSSTEVNHLLTSSHTSKGGNPPLPSTRVNDLSPTTASQHTSTLSGTDTQSNNMNTIIVSAGSAGGLLVLLAVTVIGLCVVERRRTNKKSSDNTDINSPPIPLQENKVGDGTDNQAYTGLHDHTVVYYESVEQKQPLQTRAGEERAPDVMDNGTKSTEKDSGVGELDDLDEKEESQTDQITVEYATVKKPRSKPSETNTAEAHVNDDVTAEAEDSADSKKLLNIEGIVYADLDLAPTTSSSPTLRQSELPSDESDVVYADLKI